VFVLQEFDVVALFRVLSSLLAASVTEAVDDVSSAVLTAVLGVIDSTCLNCDVQRASSLMHSTSM